MISGVCVCVYASAYIYRFDYNKLFPTCCQFYKCSNLLIDDFFSVIKKKEKLIYFLFEEKEKHSEESDLILIHLFEKRTEVKSRNPKLFPDVCQAELIFKIISYLFDIISHIIRINFAFFFC